MLYRLTNSTFRHRAILRRTEFVLRLRRRGFVSSAQSTGNFVKTKPAIARVFYPGTNNEEGQDLIEYALVVSLIAFAAIAGMSTLATDINNAFLQIGTKLVADV